MFDISQLAIKDTTTVHLLHPGTQEKLFTEDEKPIEVVLRSNAAKEYRAALKTVQGRALKRSQKKENAKLDELEDDILRLLVAATVGFNNISYKGKPLDNETAYRELYSDPQYGWLRDQVNEASGDTARFLGQ